MSVQSGKLSREVQLPLGRFQRVFTDEQEKEIVDHCKALDARYYGLTLRSLRHLLYDYAERNVINHRFNKDSKLAGRDFTRSYLKRHNMSLRLPRKISVARTMAFNKTQLTNYFSNLQDVYKKFKFPANKIYNMDETGVQTTPNNLPKHVAPIGKRDVSKAISSEQGQTVTAVCCMSAAGQYIPPFFIYKRKKMCRLLINNGPVGCDMAVTDKGYMNTQTFIVWLDHFAKYAIPTQDSPISNIG
uniref:Uncharacterized protein n=1 Tax=Cacopsylla melanoneura TaxID=428564 RepID=A0A8D8QYG4_9HEMI